MAEAEEVGEHSLKRSLGPVNLIALGIGGIIGAGLFVRTAAAIADRAGPSVVLAFIVAGIGCAFAGLCYAEFASMIPRCWQCLHLLLRDDGRAGRMDHRLGFDTRIRRRRVDGRHRLERVCESRARMVVIWRIPYQWTHSPFEHDAAGYAWNDEHSRGFHSPSAHAPAIRGTKESAFVNGLIVVLKVSIVLLFIGIGWGFINPANHTPLIPAPTTYATAARYHPCLRRDSWYPRRSRCRLLRLYRVRRSLDRGAGSAEIQSATCRSVFLGHWPFARFFTCFFPMC